VATTSAGTTLGGVITSAGAVLGGGGTVTPAFLNFGGSMTTLANLMRTNGLSNATTFSGYDAGSEWTVVSDGTLTAVTITRTNTTSDVTFNIRINEVDSGSVVILATNAMQTFTLALAISANEAVAIEYDSTAGSAPDFCTALVSYEKT
jgi:hypothetical protein